MVDGNAGDWRGGSLCSRVCPRKKCQSFLVIVDSHLQMFFDIGCGHTGEEKVSMVITKYVPAEKYGQLYRWISSEDSRYLLHIC